MTLFSIPNSVQMYHLDFWPMEMKKWDFVFVDGISGSGKTTFMKLVAGIQREYTGAFERSNDFLNEISLYFHDFYLLEQYSIRENCLFQSLLFDTWADNMLRVSQRFESYIDLFQLRPILHKKITELSSGEYQRVCLVRTLIREKPIIILDEPVAFLDTTNKKIVLDTLLSLHKKGITIIFSSHNPEDYKFFQTRVTKDFFIPYLLWIHE